VKSPNSKYYFVSALDLLNRKKAFYACSTIKPNSEQSEDGKPRVPRDRRVAEPTDFIREVARGLDEPWAFYIYGSEEFIS
jgi:hypothetical protein